MVENENLIQAYTSGQTINQLHIKYAADGEKVDFDGSGTDGRTIYDIGNDKIHLEQFKFIESICSDSELRLGGCEASSVEFRIVNDGISFTGKWLTIYHKLINEVSETEITNLIGYFKVYSDKLTRDKQHRDITAYNSMYYIGNTDISLWYNGLPFPITLKNFRDSLFQKLGYEQEDVILPNDDKLLYMVDSYDELFAVDVLKDICEINGCFGIITKTDKFRYVFLKDTVGDFATEPDYIIPKNEYRQNGLEYEDFYTKPVNSVKLVQNNGNSVIYTIADTNTYICTMRVLYFGSNFETLHAVAGVVHSALDGLSYVPYKLTGIGNLALQCGDLIEIMAGNSSIKTYIFERTLEGIQGLKDTYSAQGKETLERTKNSSSSNFGGGGVASSNDFSMQVYTNTMAYNIKAEKNVQIITFNIISKKDTNIGYIATIPIRLDGGIDGEAVISYYIDAVHIENDDITKYLKSGNNVITLTNFFPISGSKRFTLTVKIALQSCDSIERLHTAQIKSLAEYGALTNVKIDNVTIPTGYIKQEGIKAIIFAEGLGEIGGWDGTLNIAEKISMINIDSGIKISPVNENIDIKIENMPNADITQSINSILINSVKII